MYELRGLPRTNFRTMGRHEILAFARLIDKAADPTTIALRRGKQYSALIQRTSPRRWEALRTCEGGTEERKGKGRWRRRWWFCVPRPWCSCLLTYLASSAGPLFFAPFFKFSTQLLYSSNLNFRLNIKAASKEAAAIRRVSSKKTLRLVEVTESRDIVDGRGTHVSGHHRLINEVLSAERISQPLTARGPGAS